MQAKLIITTAIGLWLLSLLIKDAPAWVGTAFGVIAFLAITGVIAFLMTRGSGWHALAKKYPERVPCSGPLRRCGTFQMLALNSEQNFGTRFSGGIVSVGPTSEALYIAAPAVVRWLFPTIQLPWSAVASAKPFEAPGWVQPIADSGAVYQARYDFGYTGPFLELETTEPRTCIRLPVYAIGDALGNLPSGAPASRW
jgi:hypothetical protein